jgi:hypothetical protein
VKSDLTFNVDVVLSSAEAKCEIWKLALFVITSTPRFQLIAGGGKAFE